MHRRCRNQWRRLAATGLAALFAGLTLAACDGDAQPEATPTSIDAFPDLPHVTGPLTVELHPALRLVGDADGYRYLGTPGRAVVDDVSTAPSADHTSWQTTVRFAAQSRDAVRRARDEAAGFGGVVVMTVGDTVVMAAAPTELTPGRAARLGLEKAEAWDLVDGFSR